MLTVLVEIQDIVGQTSLEIILLSQKPLFYLLASVFPLSVFKMRKKIKYLSSFAVTSVFGHLHCF